MKPGDLVKFIPSIRYQSMMSGKIVIYLSIFCTSRNKNNMIFVLANVLYHDKLCQVLKHELYNIM
jgi:hypothetical protein